MYNVMSIFLLDVFFFFWNTYNILEPTCLVVSGSLFGGILKWCTLPSKHVRVKRQLSLARLCKGKCTNNTIPHINQVHPVLSNDEMNEITKHWACVRDLQPCLLTLAAASDLHISKRRQKYSGFIFHKNLLLQDVTFINNKCNIFRLAAFMFFIFSVFRRMHSHPPTLLTAVLLSDSRNDGTYCFGYQDRTPSWRTIQNERHPKNLELWWGQKVVYLTFIVFVFLFF